MIPAGDALARKSEGERKGKHTSEPSSRALISFSMSTTCCSSAKARAQGTPRSRALVLSTNRALPPKPSVEVTADVAVETTEQMALRVVGGMMSRRATRRSDSVSSSVGGASSSELISESVTHATG